MLIEIRFGWKKEYSDTEVKVLTIGYSAGGGTSFGQSDFISLNKEYYDESGQVTCAKNIWRLFNNSNRLIKLFNRK